MEIVRIVYLVTKQNLYNGEYKRLFVYFDPVGILL
jgi:hypothetical protein